MVGGAEAFQHRRGQARIGARRPGYACVRRCAAGRGFSGKQGRRRQRGGARDGRLPQLLRQPLYFLARGVGLRDSQGKPVRIGVNGGSLNQDLVMRKMQEKPWSGIRKLAAMGLTLPPSTI